MRFAATPGALAIMQVLLGIAVATAPVTVNVPGVSLGILSFGGFYAALWLLSAAFFRIAARAAAPAQQ